VTRRLERLSAGQARRLAVGAQGLAAARPAAPGARDLAAVVRRTGLLQIDSVNVLARAHYLPVFSRVGAYDRGRLDQMSGRSPRSLFEYWGHEASLLPVSAHPLLRWRMAEVMEHAWGGMRRVVQERPQLVQAVLDDVRLRGPITASRLRVDHEPDRGRRAGPWWDWSQVKVALEYLFWAGEVTSARRVGFERAYAVPERVLPRAVLDLPTPSREEAHRALLLRAARSSGVATAQSLRDYYRLPAADARQRLAELVDEGLLLPVRVEGDGRTWYVPPDAVVPRAAEARALLAPFDPLIWERDRTHRLFGFHYRIEIYTPQPQRRHGYYVLPFLLGDRLVARVDLKADRSASALLVQASWAEPAAPPATASALADELRAMAGWLELDRVEVRPRGDLASSLASALAASVG
jgi:hypothetical protein